MCSVENNMCMVRQYTEDVNGSFFPYSLCFQLFDFTLTSEDMTKMEQLNKNDRINKFPA